MGQLVWPFRTGKNLRLQHDQRRQQPSSRGLGQGGEAFGFIGEP